MSGRLFGAAFAAGLAAVAWVGYGYLGHSLLALGMTGLIATVFCAGALELRQARRHTAALDAAFAAPPASAESLAAWLANLPGGLRAAVERRLDGDRVALPGPALVPTLVGLLVLLGMLGTFLGLVATLRGAVSALQGSTDLATMRAALAAPVQGLGVAFGTSVAGVAASAMLGLMLALARRERSRSATVLDGLLAGALRPFTRAQRDEAAQARMLATLETAMARLEQHGERLGGQLLAGQERFHAEAGTAYATLAQSVDRTLQTRVAESARAAGAVVTTLVESTLAGLAREAALQDQRRLAAWSDALAHTGQTLQRQLGDSLARDNQLLAERERLLAQMAEVLAVLDRSADTQRTAAEATAGSAIEVASLGEAFGAAVVQFAGSSEVLIGQLQRIEAALDRSAARGDEQLAYYVAQAREIVDLSLASQRQIVGELQKVAAA